MLRARIVMFAAMFLILFSSAAMAQFPILNADQVRTWTGGKKKVVLVDARPAEEYRQGHIPGALNIMPDHIRTEAGLLPKDKSMPIIFYCRGEG